MRYVNVFQTSLGELCAAEEGGRIVEIGFWERHKAAEEEEQRVTVLTEQVRREIEEYLSGKRQEFTFPMQAEGTAFQKKVWKALVEIPYGEVRTYGQIAALAGSPKGARAVGMACNRNPIMIAVPCHRVIGGNGSLTGYAGGLDVKEKLLELEKTIE